MCVGVIPHLSRLSVQYMQTPAGKYTTKNLKKIVDTGQLPVNCRHSLASASINQLHNKQVPMQYRIPVTIQNPLDCKRTIANQSPSSQGNQFESRCSTDVLHKQSFEIHSAWINCPRSTPLSKPQYSIMYKIVKHAFQ